MADKTIINASEGNEIPALNNLVSKSTDKGVRNAISNNNLSDAKNANKPISNTPITAGNQKNSCQINNELSKIKTPVDK